MLSNNWIISLKGTIYLVILTLVNSQPVNPQSKSIGEVFVIGGIHQAHESAKLYTYQRMGEIYLHLKPTILCVEAEQKYMDDGSETGMPFDFKKFMVPYAQKDKIPIFGIDWWDKEKGDKWNQIQQRAYSDSELTSEINLVGGIFALLDEYFKAKDFEDINSEYITQLWSAKNEFKFNVLKQHPDYKFIAEFEEERNRNITQNIINVVMMHPSDRILVAIGIDHKYYIERELRKRGIRVLEVEDVMREWWK